MQNKLIGALLLIASGLVATLGSVGAQLANGIAFLADVISRPNPADATPHWLVFVSAAVLAATGLFFLFSKRSE